MADVLELIILSHNEHTHQLLESTWVDPQAVQGNLKLFTPILRMHFITLSLFVVLIISIQCELYNVKL